YYVICMRLSISLVNSAVSRECEPENEYLQVSDNGAWSLLRSLLASGPNLAEYTFRSACGFEPCPNSGRVSRWLAENRPAFAPVVAADLNDPQDTIAFDLSIGSLDLDAATDIYDMETLGAKLFGKMRAAGATAGIGRYNETRLFYTTDIFRIGSNDEPHWRTVHIGVDIFMKPFSPVYVPLNGSVHSLRNNAGPLDYGPTIVLEHDTSDGLPFYTLYGHLSKESLEGLYRGKRVKKGERIASIGPSSVNGGWPPHLHFQIITDMLDKLGDFPGVAPPDSREVWLSICPDPNLILNIAEEIFPTRDLAGEDIVERRRKNIGPSLSIAYRKPLNIVRGYMQHLIDEDGQVYLDGVNNVSHVGHCHPKVVEAARRQIGVLNTNTRYLHKTL
ncbi:MAG: peptidoglycan DD-metalloendopeptidase family protein, partial [Blastocatellia bacterium]